MIRPGDVIEINGTQFELLPPATTTVDVDDRPESPGCFKHANRRPRCRMIVARPINDSGQQINPKYDDQGREIGSRGAAPNRPYWTSPAPYKILRQPTPTSDEPYQLPEGTAIDLRASGVGSDDYFYVPRR